MVSARSGIVENIQELLCSIQCVIFWSFDLNMWGPTLIKAAFKEERKTESHPLPLVFYSYTGDVQNNVAFLSRCLKYKISECCLWQ